MRKIELKVITRARKEELEKILENSYKVKVRVPPENGRANERIIELISEKFGVRKNKIRIVSGETSNKKIVEIG